MPEAFNQIVRQRRVLQSGCGVAFPPVACFRVVLAHVAGELLQVVRNVLPPGVRAVFVTQAEALGLGHAVLQARPIVGDEPFAVLLPDDLIWNRNGHGALCQMADLAERESASVIAVEDVPRSATGSYGIVATGDFADRSGRISEIVEKPSPDVAPSTLAVVGRYVLDGSIFELLESTTPGAGGEIQLTDAIAALLQKKPALAYRFEGTRFDCGQHQGVVEANMRFALDNPKLRESTLAAMRKALADAETGDA